MLVSTFRPRTERDFPSNYPQSIEITAFPRRIYFGRACHKPLKPLRFEGFIPGSRKALRFVLNRSFHIQLSRKNVWITINSRNQSNHRYIIYPTFETLLFIILENAIEYSPNNKAVEVIFEENGHLLDVAVRSTGPYCDENKLLHLCDKGFRSENAKIAQEVGQGFGLNFAKKYMNYIILAWYFSQLIPIKI